MNLREELEWQKTRVAGLDKARDRLINEVAEAVGRRDRVDGNYRTAIRTREILEAAVRAEEERDEATQQVVDLADALREVRGRIHCAVEYGPGIGWLTVGRQLVEEIDKHVERIEPADGEDEDSHASLDADQEAFRRMVESYGIPYGTAMDVLRKMARGSTDGEREGALYLDPATRAEERKDDPAAQLEGWEPWDALVRARNRLREVRKLDREDLIPEVVKDLQIALRFLDAVSDDKPSAKLGDFVDATARLASDPTTNEKPAVSGDAEEPQSTRDEPEPPFPALKCWCQDREFRPEKRIDGRFVCEGCGTVIHPGVEHYAALKRWDDWRRRITADSLRGPVERGEVGS